jgi:hypothetical protein
MFLLALRDCPIPLVHSLGDYDALSWGRGVSVTTQQDLWAGRDPDGSTAQRSAAQEARMEREGEGWDDPQG